MHNPDDFIDCGSLTHGKLFGSIGGSDVVNVPFQNEDIMFVDPIYREVTKTKR
jgi:hypothetical protein